MSEITQGAPDGPAPGRTPTMGWALLPILSLMALLALPGGRTG